MGAELIQGQHLADALLALLPPSANSTVARIVAIGGAGAVEVKDIPMEIQYKLPGIFAPDDITGDDYAKLFNGDKSAYGNDHSAADMALTGYIAHQGATPDETDLVVRASGLYRPKWDEMRGAQTYGQKTIAKAFEGQPIQYSVNQGQQLPNAFADPSNWKPNYVSGGMPARRFIGPSVDGQTRLFPASALSTLVALGGAGKTTILIGIACHIAAGKDWNGKALNQRKVVMFSVEETQDELDRKFSAYIDGWSPLEQQAATDNLLLVSCLGMDARLTRISKNQQDGSGMAEKMIELLTCFSLQDGLVVLDHMQGFASGDLNTSETATSICREANKIVKATGAAVVMAAHISKANISADKLEQGFAVGSLAFENAVRQMSGLIRMSDEKAKEYGVTATQGDYRWLGLPKNSYGDTEGGVWLQKKYVPKYHTVVFEPVQLMAQYKGPKKSANQVLADQVKAYLSANPWTTRNQLDGLAGKDGKFKASKERVRDAVKAGLDSGTIEVIPVSDADRAGNGLSKQVKEVLRVKP